MFRGNMDIIGGALVLTLALIGLGIYLHGGNFQ